MAILARAGRAPPITPKLLRLSHSSPLTVLEARNQYLKRIYAPFEQLKPNSPEYKQLAKSGKVWENFFEPADSERYGYKLWQTKHSDLLQEIDRYKASMKLPIGQIAKTLVAEYAHQSVAIEANRLALGISVQISDYLTEKVFSKIELDALSADELLELPTPSLEETLNMAEDAEVAEMKNHIVATRWIAEVAASQPGTKGLNEQEMRCLAALTVKNTASVSNTGEYIGWGRRVAIGNYRATPLHAKSNPVKSIFPYPLEVPACMQRFFEWRDRVHTERQIHPLLVACQLLIYFLHVHPFPDGNGRVGRMLMHDYMVRTGYLPIVMRNLVREDYLRMIADCQDGNTEEFVLRILSTQLEQLKVFKMREMEY